MHDCDYQKYTVAGLEVDTHELGQYEYEVLSLDLFLLV